MATKRWLGNAAGVYDVWTISLSGTVTSQTYTITINSKTVTYVSGGGDTVASVLAALVAAWTSTTSPAAPEFSELTPVVSGTTIVATGNTLGKPSTITLNTPGTATFSIAHTTSATGPNDFTNAANWSTGAAPANSDVLVFDNGNVDCLYNLGSSLTGVTVLVQPGFEGRIGLPFINNDTRVSYAEYRATALTLAGGTVTINAPSVKRCNLAFGANTATVRVLDTGTSEDSTPAVLITGGNGSSELDITKGNVGVAYYLGTTATFPTVKTGFASNPVSDVVLVLGAGVTLTNVRQNGGIVTVQSSSTLLSLGQSGGVLILQDAAATTITALNGTVILKTVSTVATINLYNAAILDCDQDPRAKDITNAIACFDRAVTIKDNMKSINSGTLTLSLSSLDQINVFHGGNLTMVLT